MPTNNCTFNHKAVPKIKLNFSITGYGLGLWALHDLHHSYPKPIPMVRD